MSDPLAIWRAVEQAGGAANYIQQQLEQHGWLVARRDTDKMSKHELEAYKKQLQTEAAEKRRLRKEAWTAYKASHIVHLGETIFWNDDWDYDRWDLENAEERAAENGLPPLDKPAQLAEALGITVAQLRWFAFHRDLATSVHYQRFTIPKRGGGERAIWAPKKGLKKIQRWILRNIAERLLVHGSAHGFLPGRSIISNAARHTDAKIVLKMDLKDFFPTVTLPRVKGVFRKAGYREQIALLLGLLCTESPREIVERNGRKYFVAMGPRCLPQGAPTSPAITNALCLKLDRRLTALARKFGWRYTRYADDLTFSLPNKLSDAEAKAAEAKLKPLIGLTKRVVAAEGFQVHADKTRVMRRGRRQQVTGIVVNGEGTPRVPREIRRRLRAAIHNRKKGVPPREGESLATLKGFAAYLHPLHRDEARAALEQLDALAGNVTAGGGASDTTPTNVPGDPNRPA